LPNIKSQIKRDKTNIKSAEKNQVLRTKVKSLSKKFRQTVDAKDNDGVKEVMSSYFKALDKAAKANTVKDNFAANKKSKAAKYLNKAEAAKLNKTVEIKSNKIEEAKPVKAEKAKPVKAEKAKPVKAEKSKPVKAEETK
jgi:small subunit ribosomal protein S20